MEEPSISKTDMNDLILDFFMITGMKECFDQFSVEINHTGNIKENPLLEERDRIWSHIINGDIRAAISLINDIDSNILRENNALSFHLQKQALLEIIKQNKSGTEALKFAQIQLAPQVKDNESFLHEVETIMSLLLFQNKEESPDKHLLDDSQRYKTAEIVNGVLLKRQKLNDQSKLTTLMKMIMWAQKECIQEKQLSVPKVVDIQNAIITDEDCEIEL